MFNLKDIKEKESRYIRPGIENNVVIGSITGHAPEGGTAYLEIIFYKATGTIEDGARVKLWLSDRSKTSSMLKLQHLATTEELKKALIEADNKSDNVEEFATNVNTVLAGHKLRIKFCGEEFTGRDGKVRQKAILGLPLFAEDLSIPLANTKLTFDKNNSYDYKRITTEATTEAELTSAPATTEGEGNDLPF